MNSDDLLHSRARQRKTFLRRVGKGLDVEQAAHSSGKGRNYFLTSPFIEPATEPVTCLLTTPSLLSRASAQLHFGRGDLEGFSRLLLSHGDLDHVRFHHNLAIFITSFHLDGVLSWLV